MAEADVVDDAWPPVTRDSFFGGRLTLTQPLKGHRSGTDAVLLAAAVPRDFVGRVFDAGAGVGAVGLGVAVACPQVDVTLIENDPACTALAAENIVANGLAGRARIAACDLLSREALRVHLPEPADLVVTNPPFYRPERVRASPDAARRAAHVATGFDIAGWLDACVECLAPKGALIVIHGTEEVPAMLAALAGQLGGATLLPIQPRAGQPAVRVLLRAVRGSRAPFRIVPSLVLHAGRSFTDEAAALHAGRAAIDW